jgi:HK97 gp10 family phage protein
MPSKYINNRDKTQKQIEDNLSKGIEAVIFNTEATIKIEFTKFGKPPILTGDLRRSVTAKMEDKLKGVVFTASTEGTKEIDYAIYVEYGTVKMTPRPFMRNGSESAKKTNNALMERAMK